VHFDLHGLDRLDEIVGGTYGQGGLLVATGAGAVVECLGQPTAGRWPCGALKVPQLPLGGSAALRAAVVSRLSDASGRLRAAVSFADEPGVAIFETAPEATEWLPVGDVTGREEHFLSMSDSGQELLLGAPNGGLTKWPLGLGGPTSVPTPRHEAGLSDVAMTASLKWKAACHLGSDKFARFGLGSSSPELLVSSSASVVV